MSTSRTLRLGSTAGVTVSGDGTPAVTLSGPLTQLNAALEDLVFTPAADSNGTVTLAVAFTDLGGQTASVDDALRLTL